jgi:hypothetical protein
VPHMRTIWPSLAYLQKWGSSWHWGYEVREVCKHIYVCTTIYVCSTIINLTTKSWLKFCKNDKGEPKKKEEEGSTNPYMYKRY